MYVSGRLIKSYKLLGFCFCYLNVIKRTGVCQGHCNFCKVCVPGSMYFVGPGTTFLSEKNC